MKVTFKTGLGLGRGSGIPVTSVPRDWDSLKCEKDTVRPCLKTDRQRSLASGLTFLLHRVKLLTLREETGQTPSQRQILKQKFLTMTS